MNAVMDRNLTSLRRRLDAIAIQQLRNELQLLATENEELRSQLIWAEDAAESWREDALSMQLQLCEASGGSPGITQGGELVVVQGATPPPIASSAIRSAFDIAVNVVAGEFNCTEADIRLGLTHRDARISSRFSEELAAAMTKQVA